MSARVLPSKSVDCALQMANQFDSDYPAILWQLAIILWFSAIEDVRDGSGEIYRF